MAPHTDHADRLDQESTLDQDSSSPARPARFGVSRRRLLGGAAIGLGVAAGGGAAAAVLTGDSGGAGAAPVPFRGAHQAGIDTPAQDRMAFAAFDVVPGTRRADLADLLRRWTAAAEAMTAGRTVPGAVEAAAPPADTGEAAGLGPARLTVTLGFGPALFDDRFGLAARRPAALAPLPALPNENLDPAWTGGDLGVQACSDDPQVAFHAVRNLARLGFGTVTVRWLELGFGRTGATGATQETPRNLMGFKDGTRNIRADQTDLLNRHVWIRPGTDQPWLVGGSYLIARRIRMHLETWDRDSLGDQEAVFGRQKADGAPLTGRQESDTPDFAALAADGSPLIPADAHIRLAAPENNGGLHILRRGYSFTDGVDAATGQLTAGLFFVAFVNDPANFVTLQRRLGSQDALREYIQHVGSAVFVCPPGLAPGQTWADQLTPD